MARLLARKDALSMVTVIDGNNLSGFKISAIHDNNESGKLLSVLNKMSKKRKKMGWGFFSMKSFFPSKTGNYNYYFFFKKTNWVLSLIYKWYNCKDCLPPLDIAASLPEF